jgi:AP-4 complex subunit epsilon-1
MNSHKTHSFSIYLMTITSYIVYEVVKTVTTIYPNMILLDTAATSISRFIRSDSHNLKYIGIKGLAAIVKDHPK